NGGGGVNLCHHWSFWVWAGVPYGGGLHGAGESGAPRPTSSGSGGAGGGGSGRGSTGPGPCSPHAASERPPHPRVPPRRGALATYQSTDANGIATYSVISDDIGGTQALRVLAPTNPAPGVPHNFLYVLPVEAGLGSVYGDGLQTLRALGAQNQYNLTIVEPSF